MENSDLNNLVVELSRSALTRVDPEEVPAFEVLAELYEKDARQGRRRKTDTLGFGVDASNAVAPYLFAIVEPVAMYIIRETAQMFEHDASVAAHAWLSRLHPGRTKAATLGAELSPNQLHHIRDTVRQRAVDMRLSPKRADLLADAIVGSLA